MYEEIVFLGPGDLDSEYNLKDEAAEFDGSD